jgi:uncharacterized protein DUF5996
MSKTDRATALGSWPELALADWRDTYTTLHMWSQMVGKTRLALAPMMNHWWQVAFYVTARGLTTSPMPCRERTFEVDFDFTDHELVVRTNDGFTGTMPLVPRTVADFYREYLGLLQSLELDVRLAWPVPVEVEEAIPFAEDATHRSYDADAAHRCWQILVQNDRVFKKFRARFVGKCSPVHFWWGGFDLACTRFSGRRAPLHPGGIPNTPDRVAQEGYSHECISAGWWPGNKQLPEPAYYAYAYPEPEGLPSARIQPAGAYYHSDLHEFVLPYDAVRTSSTPDEKLLSFLQSTYEAAAELAAWDRSALEFSVADRAGL